MTPPAPQQPAAPEAAATVSGTSPGLNRVVLSLSATEKTWLSITSDGKQIFSGILEPSQSEMATMMKVGNAGGIEVVLNGKPIGPLGPRGEVRTVLFAPENFQILSPAEPLQPASAFENIIESELLHGGEFFQFDQVNADGFTACSISFSTALLTNRFGILGCFHRSILTGVASPSSRMNGNASQVS